MSAAEQRHYCPVCNAVFRTPFSRCPLDGNVLAELDGDPLVGTTLDGRYVIEECIGEGGMGRVYRAKHTRMSRNFAIKILFGDHAGDARMRSRFAREAEAVSRLSHANVISVVDFGETAGGLLYLVMDLAQGESLAHLMIREAPIEPVRAVGILSKLAKGLAHAHSQGLVHRDFKGENVIMVVEEEQEVPKIVDFGICMITEDSPSSTMLTSNGMVMGTPAVMAPEQASGDTVDHRTDLFSLGIVGYQMLSGELPFEGTPLDMARKNLYEQIPSIHERSGVYVAPALEAVIHKLTAKQPNDRYQSAKEILTDLQTLTNLESSGEWIPTPLPPPVPGLGAGVGESGYPESGPIPTPNFQPPNYSGGYAGGQLMSGQHMSSTPMTTELVGEFAKPPTSSNRKAILVGLVGIVVVAAVAFGVSGGDKSTDETSAAALHGVDGEHKTTEPGADLETTNSDPLPVPDAGSAAVKTAIPTTDGGTIVTETNVPTENTTSKVVTKTPNRKNANRRNDRKNRHNKTQATEKAKPKATLVEIKQLYKGVAGALDRLEAAKGKTKYSQLRHDYNAISYSRLVRDESIQPVYHQSLLRLRRKIRAAHK